MGGHGVPVFGSCATQLEEKLMVGHRNCIYLCDLGLAELPIYYCKVIQCVFLSHSPAFSRRPVLVLSNKAPSARGRTHALRLPAVKPLLTQAATQHSLGY